MEEYEVISIPVSDGTERDFGIFMPKHLAGQWHVNSNTKYSLKLS